MTVDSLIHRRLPAAEDSVWDKRAEAFERTTLGDFIIIQAQVFRDLADGDNSRIIRLIGAVAPRLRQFAESRRYNIEARELAEFVRNIIPS